MANRAKMPQADRAKQFMPFDGVKGLQEALREKERIVVNVDKRELSPDYQAELDLKMQQVRPGCMVRVVYFHEDAYLEKRGMVSRLDVDGRILKVVNDTIPFEDLFDIEVLDAPWMRR